LAFVRYGALVASNDAAAIVQGGAALIAELTARLGDDHSVTPRYRINVANLAATDAELRRQLEPACRALANLHPKLVRSIADCSAAAALVALIADDNEAAATWSEFHARANAGSSRRVLRSRAGALSALGRRDPAAAIVALGDGEAWVREQAELPSRSRLHAFELAASAGRGCTGGSIRRRGRDRRRLASPRATHEHRARDRRGTSSRAARRARRTVIRERPR
jgi:hypothetical protein